MPLIQNALRCSGRDFKQNEIDYIVLITKRFANLARTELSDTICEHLDWKTPAGGNKRNSCSKLLEMLEAQNIIVLPKKGAYTKGSKPKAMTTTSATDPKGPLIGNLHDAQPITLSVVTDSADKLLWNEYIHRYHYLGYKRFQGRTIRYFIMSQGQPVGCLLITRGVQGIEARDKWIGWTYQTRLNNSAWVMNNARFLIFPWVQIPHLASHVLGKLGRQVADDYEVAWGYRPLLLETFVDDQRYAGTCYKAANWIEVGYTKGTGLIRPNHNYSTQKKKIFVYPLVKNAVELLCGVLATD